MATQYLTPGANWSGGTTFVPTGAASNIAAITDSSDSSYILRDLNTVTGSYAFELSNYTLAANERIQSVRVNLRILTNNAATATTGKLYVKQGYITDRPSKTTRYGTADQFLGIKSVATWVYGARRTKAPDGADWDQDRLNAFAVQVTDYAGSGPDRMRILEAQVEVVVNTKPTITLTAPSTTVTDTSRPAVNWTYTDTEGDAQTHYRVKVFTQAQYTASDFSPDTSTAAQDTGEVASADAGTAIGDDLTNGATYRVYAKAGHTLGSTVFWSDWQYVEFSVTYDSQPAPYLSASYSPSLNRVALNAVASTNYMTDDDATFESTIGGWVQGAACTIQRTTTQAYIGAASLEITASSGSTMSARSSRYTVPSDGQYVSGTFWTRPSAIARVVNARFRFSNAADTTISFVDGATSTQTVGAWKQYSVSGAIPAGATHVQLVAQVASPTAGDIHYVDKCALFNGTTVSWSPGGLTDAQQIVFERSDDAGVSWTEIDTVSALAPNQVGQADDHTAPRNGTPQYRARVVGTKAQNIVASPNSSLVAVRVPNDGTWWVKAVDDSSLNSGSLRITGPLNMKKDQSVGVFRPLGRSRAVVVGNEIQGYDGTYGIVAQGADEWDIVERLFFTYNGTLIVQSPFGDQKYVRVTDRSVQKSGTADLPQYRASVDYVEVDS